jgi:23S rRNA pseudouridine1911/1915/1917 synthase
MLPNESRTRIAAHIGSGAVLVSGKPCKPSLRLEPGMEVEVEPICASPAHEIAPIQMPLEIAYEDAWMIVIDKPAGLSVHPSATSRLPTLVHALLGRSALSSAGGGYRPGIVHRLDKDTSGLLLVAKDDSTHRALQAAIQNRTVKRTYWAWVRGIPAQQQFTIRTFLGRHPKRRQRMAVVREDAPGARLAITHFSVADSRGGVSRLECKLETGRTHQIRVHLASVGLPILGDPVYGVPWPGVSRQALHAASLEFVHPITGLTIAVSSPVPNDLASLCAPG